MVKFHIIGGKRELPKKCCLKIDQPQWVKSTEQFINLKRTLEPQLDRSEKTCV